MCGVGWVQVARDWTPFFPVEGVVEYYCCLVSQLCPTLCDLHGLQHTMLPCPSPSPGACSNACPLSQWCHLTISSSVTPFFSCLQSSPSSGSILMSRLVFKLKQNLWRSIIPSGWESWSRDLGSLGPIWCSAPPEIGSRISAGSLNTHCLEGFLEEVVMISIPITFWTSK